MRRGVATLLVIAFVMIFFSSSVFSQAAKSSGQTGPPIKIGGALSLTGPWAETGKWVKEGYDLWLEDINRKGGLLGRPVEMMVYDNESDTDKAVTYYERAITVAAVSDGSSPSMNLKRK